MKNGGGHFAPKLGGQFELESGGHFKLELGGQYHWNLHYDKRNQEEHFYISLFPNVGNPHFTHENPYDNMPYPDAGFRLLSLYRLWSAVEYFFPNKYITDKNWSTVLREYIPEFLNASDELQYELAAVRVIG